jgi:hypothetical protein
MALTVTSYATLQTAVASVMHRDDLTVDIPGGIALCEAEMQRKLDVAEQEATATLSVAAGTSSVALPTGFVAMRRLQQNYGGGLRTLYPTSLSKPGAQVESLGGWAQNVAVKGSTLVITPTPAEAQVLILDYYAKFTHLSDSNPSNWIVEGHPDVYLYGTLKHMGVFVGADPRFLTRVTQFSTLYAQGLKEINDLDRRKRFGNLVTTTDAPMARRGMYDIRTGT